MIFLQAKNDPNVVAQRFLDGLQHGQYKLGHETLKDLNATVTFLLAFVRNQMNTHAPIHALPTELLQLIFLHTLAPPAAFLPFDARGARADARAEARRTIALTHVCRRWRNVALDTGALWTRVSVSFDMHALGTNSQSDLPGAAAFLARSKAAPLHVHAPFPASPSDSDLFHSALAPHASRIRSLALTLPASERSLVPSGGSGDGNGNGNGGVAHALPFALPNLESLALTTECDPFDDRRPLLDLHAPCALFPSSSSPSSSSSSSDGADEDGPPRLRRLLLRNMCWVPLAPLARLTHLFMTEGTSVPLPALLSFLSLCAPSLEVLVLADVCVDVSGTHTPLPFPMEEKDKVALPRLKRCTLGIGGALLNMRRVLAHVAFPADATVRVTGGRAFHALSHLAPFPHLAFARALDTLSVDFAPSSSSASSSACPGARSGGGGLVIRASSPPTATLNENGNRKGRRPGLLLDFPSYRGSPTECAQMRALMRALVPLERLVDVCYRVCAHQREPMHVLGGEDVILAGLKRFELVEGPCTHQGTTGEGAGAKEAREAFGDAVGRVLGRCPGLEEVEVWCADAGLPARLVAGACGPVLSRMVVHCDTFNLQGEDATAAAAALRERIDIGDVVVRRGSGSCAPSMEIPGTDVDWVDSPYEW